MYQGKGLISITGSKADVTGDERLELRSTIAYAPTLLLLSKVSVKKMIKRKP